MGYKILDVKADIHEDVEKYFVSLKVYGALKSYKKVEEDLLEIVDKHFEKIER